MAVVPDSSTPINKMLIFFMSLFDFCFILARLLYGLVVFLVADLILAVSSDLYHPVRIARNPTTVLGVNRYSIHRFFLLRGIPLTIDSIGTACSTKRCLAVFLRLPT